MNNIKTALLMLALIILFVFIGELIAGKEGMIWAFMMAVMMNGIAYWFSDKIVLFMYGAKEVKEEDLPELHSIIRELAMLMSLPMPKVYIIDTPMPNAFATGRNPKHSAVAVTTGLLNLLDKRELRGVLAHELSHIKNRDTLISLIAATIAGAIFTLARLGQWALLFSGGRRDERGSSNPLGAIGLLLMIIIAPLAAMIIQFAISRSREYEADRSAAVAISDPLSLANALRKIHYEITRRPVGDINPTTAHMFIVNPLRGENILNLFSTHPPINERIRRLEELYYALQKYNIPPIVR